MARAGILSLGTRSDASTWESGCRGLGFDVAMPIKKSYPTMEEFDTFFASTPEWIYFGGHYISSLFNHNGTVDVDFNEDTVVVTNGREEKTYSKSDNTFRLHTSCKVVLWGGCSVAGSSRDVSTMRQLFGPHVLLGFSGSTGIGMVNAMLGAGFIEDPHHFFARVAADPNDLDLVVSAWMETAKYGYGTGENERNFRAWDADGQEWELASDSNKKCMIRSGRKV